MKKDLLQRTEELRANPRSYANDEVMKQIHNEEIRNWEEFKVIKSLKNTWETFIDISAGDNVISQYEDLIKQEIEIDYCANNIVFDRNKRTISMEISLTEIEL